MTAEVRVGVCRAISMEYRSEGVEHVERFGPGELLRIPKGLEHRPVTNTGEVVSELTKSAERT